MAAPDKARKSGGGALPSTGGDDDSATEGQRLLRLVDGSLQTIATRLGVSKALVGFWRTGKKLPAPEMRRTLATLYSIPADAWDARTQADVRDLAPAALAMVAVTNRAGAEGMLQDILEKRRGNLTVQEFTRLVDAEAKARALIHNLDQAEQITETRIVQSAVMQRVRNVIFATLQAHPAALRAVADALRGTGVAT